MFNEMIERGDWVSAARLYRGDLAFGLDPALPDAFLDWLAIARETYRRRAREVLDHLLAGGEAEEASRLASVLLDYDPADPVAIAASQVHSDPRPNLTTSLGSDFPPKLFVRFVGRSSELEFLERAANACAGGSVRGVAITGEAGVGKTALLTRFLRLQAVRGSKVLTARASDVENNLPFGVVTQWARNAIDRDPRREASSASRCADHEDYLVSLLSGEVGGSSPVEDWDQFRFLEALRRLFLQTSRDRLLILSVNDMQFADAASIGFLRYVARIGTDARILFVATVRTQLGASNVPFSDTLPLQRLDLLPFSLDEVAEFIGRLADARDRQRFDPSQVFSKTGGNPLLLTSLMRDRGNESLPTHPSRGYGFFTEQIHSLSGNAEKLLAAASVAGEPISMANAALIAGIPENEMGEAASELESSGLLLRDQRGVRPRHGLVADAALEELSSFDRRSLYGRAASIYSRLQLSPAVLAVRHDIAGDRGSAFSAALRAAAAALSYMRTVNTSSF